MAADPDFVRAFTPILIIGLIAGFINQLLRKPTRRRRSRRQQNSGNSLFENFLDGIVSLLTYPFRLASKNRRFNEQHTLDQLRQLSPAQFEEYIATLFQRLGYSTDLTGGSYDGGVDVVATKDGQKCYIQCKKFITRQVPVGAMRDFFGAITALHYSAKAFFITTNVFTEEAEIFAHGKDIELVDGPKLMQYIQRTGVAAIIPKEAERCPLDNGTLVERKGKFGPFLGCSNFPNCRFTKAIQVN